MSTQPQATQTRTIALNAWTGNLNITETRYDALALARNQLGGDVAAFMVAGSHDIALKFAKAWDLLDRAYTRALDARITRLSR